MVAAPIENLTASFILGDSHFSQIEYEYRMTYFHTFILLVGMALTSNPSHAAQAEGSLKLEGVGELQWSLTPTKKAYSSSVLRVDWVVDSTPNQLRSATIMLLVERELPEVLPYVAIQNEEGQLSALKPDERTLLQESLKSYANSLKSVESQVYNFLNLILESKALERIDITKKRGRNFITTDGHPWAGGWYTAKGRLQYVVTPVGDNETQCFGRKGSKCGSDWKSPQYSRAALNHDLCHRIEGSNIWGVCADEFLKAALPGADKNLLETLF